MSVVTSKKVSSPGQGAVARVVQTRVSLPPPRVRTADTSLRLNSRKVFSLWTRVRVLIPRHGLNSCIPAPAHPTYGWIPLEPTPPFPSLVTVTSARGLMRTVEHAPTYGALEVGKTKTMTVAWISVWEKNKTRLTQEPQSLSFRRLFNTLINHF